MFLRTSSSIPLMFRYIPSTSLMFLYVFSDVHRVFLTDVLDILQVFIRYSLGICLVFLGYSLVIPPVFLRYSLDSLKVFLGIPLVCGSGFLLGGASGCIYMRLSGSLWLWVALSASGSLCVLLGASG